MKKRVWFLSVVLLLLVLFVISGCDRLIAVADKVSKLKKGNANQSNNTTLVSDDNQTDTKKISESVESDSVGVGEQTNNKSSAVVETVNKTKVSGSLELQSDLDLCPHLVQEFICDKYDLRDCKFKQIMGEDEFYPDNLFCRDGLSLKKGVSGNKYCIVQECRGITEGGIVSSFGGVMAYVEYNYDEETVKDGIMTRYKLLRCGEIQKSFIERTDCNHYFAEVKKLWK